MMLGISGFKVCSRIPILLLMTVMLVFLNSKPVDGMTVRFPTVAGRDELVVTYSEIPEKGFQFIGSNRLAEVFAFSWGAWFGHVKLEDYDVMRFRTPMNSVGLKAVYYSSKYKESHFLVNRQGEIYRNRDIYGMRLASDSPLGGLNQEIEYLSIDIMTKHICETIARKCPSLKYLNIDKPMNPCLIVYLINNLPIEYVHFNWISLGTTIHPLIHTDISENTSEKAAFYSAFLGGISPECKLTHITLPILTANLTVAKLSRLAQLRAVSFPFIEYYGNSLSEFLRESEDIPILLFPVVAPFPSVNNREAQEIPINLFRLLSEKHAIRSLSLCFRHYSKLSIRQLRVFKNLDYFFTNGITLDHICTNEIMFSATYLMIAKTSGYNHGCLKYFDKLKILIADRNYIDLRGLASNDVRVIRIGSVSVDAESYSKLKTCEFLSATEIIIPERMHLYPLPSLKMIDVGNIMEIRQHLFFWTRTVFGNQSRLFNMLPGKLELIVLHALLNDNYEGILMRMQVDRIICLTLFVMSAKKMRHINPVVVHPDVCSSHNDGVARGSLQFPFSMWSYLNVTGCVLLKE